jgi:hypothetical protein
VGDSTQYENDWSKAMKPKERGAAAEVEPYEPTERERAALDKHAQREKDRPAAPRLSVTDDYRGITFGLDHPDKTVAESLLMEAIGTADWDFCQGLVDQAKRTTSLETGADEARANFPISVIKGIKPRDEIEAMLASQMAVVHMAFMECAQELPTIHTTFSQLMSERGSTIAERMYLREERKQLHNEYLALLDSTQRAIKGFARTFCMQVETLKGCRAKNEPSTTVQQVNVSQGAQAIVGNVTHAAPQPSQDNRTAPQRSLTDQQQSPMPIIENSPRKKAVPVRRKDQ